MPSPPPILPYDRHNPQKDPASNRILLFFWLGMFATCTLYAAILILYLYNSPDLEILFSPFFDGLIIPYVTGILLAIPATLFLGLTLWLRLKIIREIRYARPRAALLCGMIFAAYPSIAFIRMLPEKFVPPLLWLGLAWIILVPTLAGILLSPRSHLRDF